MPLYIECCYAECRLCWVSQISPLCWVSLCCNHYAESLCWMSWRLFVHLYACLSVSLWIHLSLSILSFWLHDCTPICFSVYMSPSLSICLSVSLCRFICLSFIASVSLSVCLSVNPFLHLSVQCLISWSSKLIHSLQFVYNSVFSQDFLSFNGFQFIFAHGQIL